MGNCVADCSSPVVPTQLVATLDITRTTFSDRDFLAIVQKLIVKLKLDRWDIFRRQQREDNLVRMSTVDKDDSAFAPRLIDKLPLLPSTICSLLTAVGSTDNRSNPCCLNRKLLASTFVFFVKV